MATINRSQRETMNIFKDALLESTNFSNEGETENPTTLQDVVLNYLCKNINEICVTKPVIITPKRRRVHSGSNHSFVSEIDLHDKMYLVGNHNTHSFTNDVQADNLPNSIDRDESTTALLKLVSSDPFNEKTKDYSTDNLKQVMRFPRIGDEDDTFLHTDLSEQLLERLCLKGTENKPITDLNLTLFHPHNTRLRAVRLTNVSRLTLDGLRVLREHNINELEIRGLSNATISDVVGQCLGNWTINNMKSLNVSHSLLMLPNGYTSMVFQLGKLKNLTSLNVSGTGLNAASLDALVENLCKLENLDISCTKVGDIGCLEKLKNTLRSLNLYGLTFAPNPEAVKDAIRAISGMKVLRHLDISDEKDLQHPFDMLNINQGKIPAVQFLTQTMEQLPSLVSLDLSGKEDLRVGVEGVTNCLKEYINHHRNLSFLGLTLTNVCEADLFGTKRSPREICPLELERYCPPQLVISGSGDERQVLESLRRYSNRPSYVHKTFHHLFQLTHGYERPRIDIIELVVECSMKYQSVFGIQMAATACLFNLSKETNSQKLHPKVLSKIVNVDLDAMEGFPQHQQLQKNVLLTLCNDRILQDVKFDKYRCARLVMDCLCTWPDPAMNRMSVAICSILAAKITTKETSKLGSTAKYMKKLLQIVRTKTDAGIDLNNNEWVTMKFTLSALWNLTDESPNTCRVFLDEGGMELFLRVIQTYPSKIEIETKVLGLLNNIAEVKDLRSYIMDSRLIQELRKLMKSAKIEVSYFAAGIVAHLASDDSEAWNLASIPKDDITNELKSIVSQWETPDSEMVAYRSFTPFFPLMAVNQEYSVQLWAVWAIHHVCTKNPKRYLPMLVYQEGIKVIATLVDAKVEGAVNDMCQEVLDIVVKECVLSKSVLLALQKEIERERLSNEWHRKDTMIKNTNFVGNIHSNSSKATNSKTDSTTEGRTNKCISDSDTSQGNESSSDESDSSNETSIENTDSRDNDIPMQQYNDLDSE